MSVINPIALRSTKPFEMAQEVLEQLNLWNAKLQDQFLKSPTYGANGYCSGDTFLCVKEVGIHSYLGHGSRSEHIIASSSLDYIEEHVRHGNFIHYNFIYDLYEIKPSNWAFYGLGWQYDSGGYTAKRSFIMNSSSLLTSVENMRELIRVAPRMAKGGLGQLMDPEAAEVELLKILAGSL